MPMIIEVFYRDGTREDIKCYVCAVDNGDIIYTDERVGTQRISHTKFEVAYIKFNKDVLGYK